MTEGVAAEMLAMLATWCREAGQGHAYTYHLGNLARDRRSSPVLNAVADTVLLLSETRFLRLQQARVGERPLQDDRWVYLAVRSGHGYAPSAVVNMSITSFEWRALRAIRDRDPGTGIARAVRDALVYPSLTTPAFARQMISTLQKRDLIRPFGEKGWQLSPAGLKALG